MSLLIPVFLTISFFITLYKSTTNKKFPFIEIILNIISSGFIIYYMWNISIIFTVLCVIISFILFLFLSYEIVLICSDEV